MPQRRRGAKRGRPKSGKADTEDAHLPALSVHSLVPVPGIDSADTDSDAEGVDAAFQPPVTAPAKHSLEWQGCASGQLAHVLVSQTPDELLHGVAGSPAQAAGLVRRLHAALHHTVHHCERLSLQVMDATMKLENSAHALNNAKTALLVMQSKHELTAQLSQTAAAPAAPLPSHSRTGSQSSTRGSPTRPAQTTTGRRGRAASQRGRTAPR